ncbi:hypothetical protein CMI47_10015 [Candidatus Pacearchaeota archaeon]|jgi:hypothetical protein|nr:hypothetical protein [Candidatus Pacearchaeota archaeon]|tara:strand:- start:621 stop:968 length:348 start_codon:yes stop_codon:yes gene_type:complete
MANLTGFRRDNDGLFATKDPSSNIQWGLDFTDYLASGDSISSASATISTVTGDSTPLDFPTNMATDVYITGGKLVSIRLEAGSVQNVYTIKVTIVTAQGDTDARSFRVIVQEKTL